MTIIDVTCGSAPVQESGPVACIRGYVRGLRTFRSYGFRGRRLPVGILVVLKAARSDGPEHPPSSAFSGQSTSPTWRRPVKVTSQNASTGLIEAERCSCTSCAGSGTGKPLRLTRRDILMISRYQGRPQCLYIAHRGLSEDALVLPIELARTFVSHLERCTRSIKFLCEHLLPCCMEPKLLLKLNRTHCCEATEVMMQT